ncbi:MAG: glycosyltransferase family 2 protein [candidate division KSB1 bacterium]|nr:glycosyltransferase family 2 protein [candidate division KSB1 bacterium]
MMSELQISIVIPVYASMDCLKTLAQRLKDVLNPLKRRYEIILVNDCSPDKSWETILGLCQENPSIMGVNLRRNFGQHNAVMAGLQYASGESIVIMDDDLQHDPVHIPDLIHKLEKGYDVCYGRYTRKKHSWFKNFGSWFNDKVANIILKKPKDIYLSSFKALKGDVAAEILKYDGPYPYVDGLIFRVTRNITQIDIVHHERFSGKGNYTLGKSLNLWLKLATNFSIFPLRIATFLGFLSSGIGFLLGLYYIILHLIGIQTPAGWSSLIVAVLFIGGIQLVSLGIIGEYVGRLFLHKSGEPQYTINQVIHHSNE